MFSFSARGNSQEVVRSLRAIPDTLMGGDAFGVLLRDRIAEAIEMAPEPQAPYVVRCSGNGYGEHGPVVLSVNVSTEGLKEGDQIGSAGTFRLPSLKLDQIPSGLDLPLKLEAPLPEGKVAPGEPEPPQSA
jgi:hypothetical protein